MEASYSTGPLQTIGISEPSLFNVTYRIRQKYQMVEDLDHNVAREYNSNVLHYILRCIMSDYRIYSTFTPADTMVTHARANFDRLLRQCDALHLLPRIALGFAPNRIPMNHYPIRDTATARSTVVETQRSNVSHFLTNLCRNFAVYCTSYGPSADISVPTISIILPRMDKVSDDEDYGECKRILEKTWDPFDESSYVVRFAVGEIRPAGEIYHYERVPMGASLSPDESDKFPEPQAGTFGCYCIDTNSKKIYGLTAGHVARRMPNPTISALYAPATKPYQEAIVSTKSWIDSANKKKGKQGLKYWTDMYEELSNLDRLFSSTIVASTVTSPSPPHLKLDYALLNIQQDRIADNRLRKLPEFKGNIPFHLDLPTADKLVLPTSPVVEGQLVWKLGARTGLTQGTIIENVEARWRRYTTVIVPRNDDDWQTTPVTTAPGILGIAPEQGSFREFADVGDSGAAIVRFVKEESKKESFDVVRSELLGILYAVIFEDERKKYVGVYLPIPDIIEDIKKQTGIEISLDVPDKLTEEWAYRKLGWGHSREDLR